MAAVDQRSGNMVPNDSLHIPAKSNRPVSWHPSSKIGPHPIYHSSYPMPYLNTPNDFQIFDFPPTPAAYSGYASPSSSFSPISAPFTGYDEQYPYLDSSVPYTSNRNPAQDGHVDGQQMGHYTSTPSDNTDSAFYSHFDWNSFAANGFERSTAPPTPENFLPIQHPDPTFPTDESIPYHSLSDSPQEDDGEILCGMGLYDSPDVGKTAAFDPQLDNYRSSMMSQLLGPTYRREPMGKGLKLEETWNPPPSDDENDDKDEEEDGEGDEDEDIMAEVGDLGTTKTPNLPVQRTSFHKSTLSDFTVQNNERINWL